MYRFLYFPKKKQISAGYHKPIVISFAMKRAIVYNIEGKMIKDWKICADRPIDLGKICKHSGDLRDSSNNL